MPTYPFNSAILRYIPASLLLCGAVQASAQTFSGLPTGGGLDARKVVETRYSASGATGPSAPVKKIDGSLVTLMVENVTGATAGDIVPLSFAQVFAPGEFPRDRGLQGKTASGTLPLQVDVKAVHADGSIRHAVISTLVPRPEKRKPLALGLIVAASGLPATDGAAATPKPAATATVSATINGKRYSASLARPPDSKGGWLAGPVANEWHASVPLRSAAGEDHPHLTVRFALRTYHGASRARVDVTVENNWAYEPGPRNFSYDAEIAIDGKPVFSKPGMLHYHHARWRKVFWSGGDPGVEVHPDMRHLIASGAVPNYDPALQAAEPALAELQALWKGERIEPMGTGAAMPYMPTTGGRADIGLLPGWAALYLLSADTRARRVTLGTGDLAGSYSMHYRDKRTGRPVSLLDHPYMTVLQGRADTRNPATGKLEAFPPCAAPDACTSPNAEDRAHQPSLAYLPYLLTGDHYYLEELQFWAMYNVFWSNPPYREYAKGLLKTDQLRGSAWALRTLAHAAWITPDGDRLKSHFLKLLDNNLDWYNTHYTRNPRANKLGVIVDGAMAYDNGIGLAPWQDDFFTSAVGHVADLGFEKARPLLTWKASFPVARMIGPGYCWIEAAAYKMQVRDSEAAPLYDSIGKVYRANHTPEFATLPCASPEMAAALKLKPGEMNGTAHSSSGQPAILQPALAYAAGVAGEPGRKAWERFMARNVKPDYSLAPQFAIVPR